MKAFIRHEDKILLLRQSGEYVDGTHEGKYEIPGGRLQEGEPWREAFLREIHEETGLKVTIGKPFHVDEWWPEPHGEKWHVVATFFECFSDTSRVTLSQDHDAYAWIDPHTYRDLPIIPGDEPTYQAYLHHFTS